MGIAGEGEEHEEEAKEHPLVAPRQLKHTLQATFNFGGGPIIQPGNAIKPKQNKKDRTRQKNGKLKPQLWTRVREVNSYEQPKFMENYFEQDYGTVEGQVG